MSLAITLISERASNMGNFKQDLISVGAAVIGIGLTVRGQREQRKQQKRAVAASERAQRAQIRQTNLQQQRQRRQQIREARALRATAVASAEAQGVSPASSVVPGTTGSLQTQLSTNLGFLAQSSANITDINRALGERTTALSEAATAGAQSELGLTIFGQAEKIGSIFKSGGGGTA